MDLLAYWRWDNYIRDTDGGADFHFNSNQKRLHSEIEIGERLWLVGGRQDAGGIQYVLLACLQVSAKALNASGYKYGKYRLWGDRTLSRYFSADGPDMTELLLRFRFEPLGTIKEKRRIGQSLQTIRRLIESDVGLLITWSKDLTTNGAPS
jgi:5-methylcytosine-specific restriction enzyme A